MEAWEVLERAVDAIERRNWKQGPLGDGAGLCAGNAIALCDVDLPTTRAAQIALSKALPEMPAHDKRYAWLCADEPHLPRIYAWNDAPGRTKEEVVAMLRAVAVSLRAAARTAGTRQPVAESTDAGVDGGDAALMERMS